MKIYRLFDATRCLLFGKSCILSDEEPTGMDSVICPSPFLIISLDFYQIRCCFVAVLNARIDARVDDMVKAGLVEEMLEFHRLYNEQQLRDGLYVKLPFLGLQFD